MVGIGQSLALIALRFMLTSAQSTGAVLSSPAIEGQKVQLAADAWIYGLPAYLIQMTRNYYLQLGIPLNYVQAAPGLSNPATASVVRSNADTAYSTAFFDLSQGPVTLHIPSITDRYFVAAMYDAYSNNFASPGTFQNSPAGNYTIYGPADAFRAPTTVFSIISQTNDVWMIARFYVMNATTGSADLQKVSLLQRQLVVTSTPANITSVMPTFNSMTSASTLGDLALQAYYGLNQAVSDNPYEAGPYNQNYSSVGLAIGQSFRPTISTASLAFAQVTANLSIAQSIQRSGALQSLGNDWVIPTTIGAYGDNFLARAYTANTGLGALTPDQAIYASYNGSTLTSAYGLRYSIYFPTGAPPVRQAGFWSLTLYDANGALAPDYINRYSLGSRDNLTRSTNGSFTIYASSQVPVGPGQLANWLPAPINQQWTPTLRIYGAADAVFSGGWTLPVIRVMT